MAAVFLSRTLSMSIKYLWSKSATGSYYFKRRVPLDVRDQVGKDFVQICLNTRDLKVAARLIDDLAKKTDKEWEFIRKPTRAATIAKAQEILRAHGIDPNDLKGQQGTEELDVGLELFHEILEEQLPSDIRESVETISDYQLSKHISPAHFTALQIVQGTLEFLASDCLQMYLEMRPDTSREGRSVNISFAYLIEHLGDRDIRTYRRADANSFVRFLLEEKKTRTTTVQRYLTNLKAAWTLAIREKEITDYANPWQSIEIPKLGQDITPRLPFKLDDYKTLYTAIGTPQDDLRCMLIIIAETGARLAEIVGLGVDDIHLEDEVPCLNIRHTPWRRLKNDQSARNVPLTPNALEAAKIALTLNGASPYLFPRYVDGKTANARSASATLNKYIRSTGIDLTVHSLRHGMADLLRAVRCPEPMRKQIQGWSKGDISEHYGEGYSLVARREELIKATSVLRC